MKAGFQRLRSAEIAALCAALIGIAAAGADADMLRGDTGKNNMSMAIHSNSFRHNGVIPVRHTCDGPNVSPPFSWAGVPAGTKSLVLIVDDPDAPDPAAPRMTWVHWVLYNIPADINGLPEDVAASGLPHGILQGLNDWQHTGYEGPCPPTGRHRYYHKLFALDVALPDLMRPSKAALDKAMQGHILAQASMIGLYQRR